MNMEYKNFSTRGSDFDTETGIFSCFPSVFGVLDSHRDIVHPGSFKKTLSERADDILLFYGHDTREFPIGKPIEQTEVPRDLLPDEITDKHPEATGGLFVRNKLSDTASGRDIHTLLRDGVLKRMSFGFNPIKVDFDEDKEGMSFRNVHEVRLWEYSVVPFSSNPISIVTQVKAVVPFKKYPLADKSMSWDGPAQRAATDDQGVLRRISTWVDESQANEDGNLPKSAFKLPHHLASGSNATVWRGVTAAMAALLGARGGVKGMSEADRRKAYSHLAKHYAEFEEEAPEFRDYSDYSEKDLAELCGSEETEEKGESLAKFLNARIDAMETDSRTRGDILSSLANAAKISVSTVNQILNGQIVRPPDERLRAFARVLDVSFDRLARLANNDAEKANIVNIEIPDLEAIAQLGAQSPSDAQEAITNHLNAIKEIEGALKEHRDSLESLSYQLNPIRTTCARSRLLQFDLSLT